MGYSADKFTAHACLHWLGEGEGEQESGFEVMFYGADNERVDWSFEDDDNDEIKNAMFDLVRDWEGFKELLVDSYLLVLLAGTYKVTSYQSMDDWSAELEVVTEWSYIRELKESEAAHVNEQLEREAESDDA
jgi:hypothetical protein